MSIFTVKALTLEQKALVADIQYRRERMKAWRKLVPDCPLSEGAYCAELLKGWSGVGPATLGECRAVWCPRLEEKKL